MRKAKGLDYREKDKYIKIPRCVTELGKFLGQKEGYLMEGGITSQIRQSLYNVLIGYF